MRERSETVARRDSVRASSVLTRVSASRRVSSSRRTRRASSAAAATGGSLAASSSRGDQLAFVDLHRGGVARDLTTGRVDLVEHAPHLGRVGHEGLEHTFVGDGRELTGQAPALLAEQRGGAGGPLAQRLDTAERVGDVAVTGGGERALGVEHREVEVAQATLHRRFLGRQLAGTVAQAFAASLEAGDLVTGEVQADRPQLLDQAAVTARGVGLALQRRQLATHLAQQVVEPQQVALGGLEPALGALAALAELQDAGGLFDDRAAILGAGVEHGVELALTHDHVLLAADAGVGEQLLDVEQAAGRAVELVLGVTGAEQRAGDGDLGELDRQQPAELSMVSDTSARPSAGRSGVPAKMKSSIFPPRSVRGPWAPSTQATASTRFDFPDPLGPTTTVTPGSNSSTVLSAKDLKPRSVNDLRNTRAAPIVAWVGAPGWVARTDGLTDGNWWYGSRRIVASARFRPADGPGAALDRSEAGARRRAGQTWQAEQ